MKAYKIFFNGIRKYRLKGIYFFCLFYINKLNILKAVIPIKLPGIRYEIYLRFGSTDFQIAKNVLFSDEYNVNLTFIPKTIIDGGGNIGLASIVFANRYPNAKIISIEPENANYNQLRKNTKLYKNISTIKAGIWYNSSFLNICKSPLGEWAFTVEETQAPDNNSIKGISISDIITQFGWSSADLIKLDIEGSEKEIFENNPDGWLSKSKAIFVETHDRFKQGCSNSVSKAVESYNFAKSHSGEYAIYTR